MPLNPPATASSNPMVAQYAIGQVRGELERYRGRRVFFEPLFGNNGDKLIELGSLALLGSLGIELVDNPVKAEAIIINGGGAMNDVWKTGFENLARYNHEYPDIPLVVLPSSYEFRETSLTDLLSDRVSPATLYAREHYSLNILRNLKLPSMVNIGMDHDMAFELMDTEYFRTLKSKVAGEYILIVERGDSESQTGFQGRPLHNFELLRHMIPWKARQAIKRNTRGLMYVLRKEETPFVQSSIEMVKNEHHKFRNSPAYVDDISLPDVCTFQRFCDLIAGAAVVVSTRLHVSILAAILGKPTYAVAGSSAKIRGVYELSLSGRPNVLLI
jgi:exopolysaccharide biosynthesis predicted pyruvyltransferase EpsI